MVRYKDTLWCDGCGVEIRWEPIVNNGLSYCCRDCMQGNRCNCEELEDEFPPVDKSPNFTNFVNS